MFPTSFAEKGRNFSHFGKWESVYETRTCLGSEIERQIVVCVHVVHSESLVYSGHTDHNLSFYFRT
jgi:hypothetical protein